METQQLLIPARHAIDPVPAVEAALGRARGWLFARAVLDSLDLPDNPSNRRWLKACAARSRKIVTSDRGYCHRDHATLDEIDHAANRLIDWGKALIKRGLAQKRAAHQTLGLFLFLTLHASLLTLHL